MGKREQEKERTIERENKKKREQEKEREMIFQIQWRYVYPIFALWDISLYNEGCEASTNLPLSLQGGPEYQTI